MTAGAMLTASLTTVFGTLRALAVRHLAIRSPTVGGLQTMRALYAAVESGPQMAHHSQSIALQAIPIGVNAQAIAAVQAPKADR